MLFEAAQTKVNCHISCVTQYSKTHFIISLTLVTLLLDFSGQIQVEKNNKCLSYHHDCKE